MDETQKRKTYKEFGKRMDRLIIGSLLVGILIGVVAAFPFVDEFFTKYADFAAWKTVPGKAATIVALFSLATLSSALLAFAFAAYKSFSNGTTKVKDAILSSSFYGLVLIASAFCAYDILANEAVRFEARFASYGYAFALLFVSAASVIVARSGASAIARAMLEANNIPLEAFESKYTKRKAGE